MTREGRFARVVIDSRVPGLDRLFDYEIPEHLQCEAQRGVRVRVPLRGGRMATGFIVDIVDTSDFAGEVARIDKVISPVPVLTNEIWTLARTLADRAAGGAADILRVAIPTRQARVEQAWLASQPESVAPVQRQSDTPLDVAVAAGARLAFDAPSGVVSLGNERWVGAWATAIASAAAGVLAAAKSAIIVVPDYRDQRQVHAALASLVPDRAIATLDARQPNPDRYRAFLAALTGPRIVIGPRSAVYAPAQQLGAILVWDDGDPLHTEPLSPYVTTRDAALVRAQQQGAALVFASHARSTDTERLVRMGYLQSITSASSRLRVIPAALLDTHSAHATRMPAVAFQEAKAAIAHGPVLVQVAKPGHSIGAYCVTCSSAVRCAHCNGPIGKQRSSSMPGCLWCGTPAPTAKCGACGSASLRYGGRGSVRTAEELGRAFPRVPVMVADGEHERYEIDAAPRLVVATAGAAPIAAGGYRAIVLLDGDALLAGERLRVAEDVVRHWRNTMALAAEGATVVVTGATGSVAAALTSRTSAEFAARELEQRMALRFPPALRTATLTGVAEEVERASRDVAAIGGVDVLGPVTLERAKVPGTVRSVVRFGYSAGADVTRALRAAILRAGGARAGGAKLRVHVDDPEPFEGF